MLGRFFARFREDQERWPGGAPEGQGGRFAPAGAGGTGSGTTPLTQTSNLMTSMRSGSLDVTKVSNKAKEGIAKGSQAATDRGVKSLEGSQGHPGLIATALKEGKAAEPDKYLQPNLSSMRRDEETFPRNMELFRINDVNGQAVYNNFRPEDTSGAPEDIRRNVQKQMEENLRFLVTDQVQNDVGNNPSDTKIWYPGSRTLVDSKLNQYPDPITVNGKEIRLTDMSIAGAYAGISPQKDWYENVYLSDVIMDTYMTKQDFRWDAKMNDTAFGTKDSEGIWQNKKNPTRDAELKALANVVKGKTLGELTTVEEKALWIRTYNQAHMERNYRVINPDGTKGDYVKSPVSKELMPARWGGSDQVEAAIKCIESNGDRKVISEALGEKHKVRSFYNNILDPFSKNDDGTMDTHAVGAALLRPLGGSTPAVAHCLGTGAGKGIPGASNSKVSGMKGLYPVYLEAHRNVAKEFGLQTRELQSIVWETKRKMFAGLSVVQKKSIDNIWQRFYRGQVSLQQAQQLVMRRAGRLRKLNASRGTATEDEE